MFNRRQFLGVAAAAALPAAAADDLSAVRLCFAADADKLIEAIPVPLQPTEPGRVVIEFRNGATGARCQIAAVVDLHGEKYLLPLAVWISNPFELRTAREFLGLPAFAGDIEIGGGAFGLQIAGTELFRVAVGGEAEPAPGVDRLSVLTYRYLLQPDWRKGPLDTGAPVELRRLSAGSNADWGTLPKDAATTAGTFDGAFSRLGVSKPIAVAVRRSWLTDTQPAREFVEAVAAPAFEPFAFRAYFADALGLVPPTPARIRARTGASAVEAYRSRRETVVEGVTIIDVEVAVNREKHAALLPPGCQATLRPSLKLLAVRGLDDPALDEAWLLAYCLFDNRAVWYAVSHLKPSPVGSEFGREVFGYPTKTGQVDSFISPVGFGATLRRHGRTLLHVEGGFEGFSTGTSLAQMEVVALRLRPGFHNSPRAGELVVQSWYYQGLRKRIASNSLRFDFPRPAAGAANAGLNAWHEFGPARVAAVSIIDGGALQRTPARAAARVDDIEPYYRDRCDGKLPWEPATPVAEGAKRRT